MKATMAAAWRTLKRRPGICVVIVLTLALGVGVNAAVFSIFHQVLLQDLDVPRPGELVVVQSTGPRSGSISISGSGGDEQIFSYPLYEDLREASSHLTGIAGFRGINANLAAGGETTSGSGVLVTGNYFSTLELRPEVGRLFRADEVVSAGAPRLVVLSHAFWQDRYGADPGAVGKTLVVNGHTLEIIGVAPAGFHGMNPFNKVDVFMPVTLLDDLTSGINWSLEDRRSHWLYVFGRLAPGALIADAQAELDPVFRNIIRAIEVPLQQGGSANWMQRFESRNLELLPASAGQSTTHADARMPLLLLLAVTGLVLLVACVNITNLLLALGASEQGEIAVRQALGAGRRHILTQRLAVLATLALIGAVVSFPVAIATMHIVRGLLPEFAAITLSPALDWAIVGGGLIVAGLAILLAGLVPLWQLLRSSPVQAIREQSSRAGSGRTATQFRALLVSMQIAFALALLVVSGLFIQSLSNISRTDLGMQTAPVLMFSISPERNGYSAERSRDLFQTIVQRLSTMPGVVAASASMVPILSDSNWNASVTVQGYEAAPDTDTTASYNAIGPAFFDALSIPLLNGRRFDSGDINDRPKVAIVNNAFVRKFDLGQDAVGKRMGSGDELDREIVGVVADAAYSGVKAEIPPQFFVPIYQTTTVGSANFYIRAVADPAGLISGVRSLVGELDPNLPIEGLVTMDVVIEENVYLDRMIGTLASLFALLATALAAVGLFGVLTFALVQRTGEIGLRAALGAAPAGLQRMVLMQTLRLAAIGAAVGLVLAWLLGRLAQGLLFELSPLEPLVLVGAVVVLFGVVVVASWIPARRAARVQPVQALRYE